MHAPIGSHPSGTGSRCTDTMILPPQNEGRQLRCQLPAGHPGHHSALDPDGRVRRVWPRSSTDRHLQAARAASGANVTPLPKGPDLA